MKHIVITGAYGGMGYAASKALAEQGFTIFALDKNVREPEPNILPIETDVTDPESVSRAFLAVEAQTKKIYAIVHFAGIYRLDSLVEISEERFTEIFNVNLFGAFRINKAFLPLLGKGSRILLTTSELAPLSPLPFTGIYAITKTALERYADSLRMELHLLGIDVAVIRPGAVKTDLLNVSTNELDRFCRNTCVYTYNAARFKRIVDRTEARNVPPQAVANTAVCALTARRPKYVYNLNRNPLLRILNVLPASWQTSVIGRILRE